MAGSALGATSRFLNLPQEILDLIILETSITTSRSCALVCRALRRSSQARIFTDIEIIPMDENATRLYATLTQSPHLCPYIRSLSLVGVSEGDSLSWCPTLTGIIALLDAITRFSLDFSPPFCWCRLPQVLRTAICTLCRRSHLRSVQLNSLGVTDVADFAEFVSSPVLQDLRIMKMVLPAQDVPLNNELRLTACAFDLKTPTLDVVMPWLLSADSFSHLRVMNFSWNEATAAHLDKLTQHSLPCLEGLFLHSHDLTVPHDFSGTISLAKWTELHLLRVSFLLKDTTAERLGHLLAALLESVPQGLDTFVVGIYLVAIPDVPMIDWTPLAGVLTTTRFPRLACVDFDVMCVMPPTDDPAREFLDAVEHALPVLREQGFLTCSVLPRTLLRS
ncbi:hypothetical protein C8R46DRAFT_614698 [Mycena filopes]|nr:hypothetical protein C8R46DRAFT_614698 [Mycena filopes]